MSKYRIKKVAPGSYAVDICIKGKRYRRRFTPANCKSVNPKAAAEKYAQSLLDLSAVYNPGPKGIELRAFISEYLRWSETEKAPQTVRLDRWRLQVFSDWAGNNGIQYLQQVDHAAFDRFKAWYKENRGENPNNYISIVHALLRHAHRRGFIKSNPMANYKKEDIPRKEKLLFFSIAETKKIMDHLPRPFPYNFFALLLNTGMRISELIYLRTDNIDFERRTITVESRADRPTKTRRTRYVPMTELAQRLVREIHNPGNTYLFDKGNGQPLYQPNWYNRFFREFCREIGIPKGKRKVHAFRHTFTTRMFESGVKPYVISRITGDNLQTLLSKYAHINPETFQEIQKLQI